MKRGAHRRYRRALTSPNNAVPHIATNRSSARRMLAVGTPDDLMRMRSGGATVSFVMTEPTEIGTLRQHLGTHETGMRPTGAGARVLVRTDDPDGVVRKLTLDQALRAQDFHVQLRTLEDVYTELAGDEPHH